MRWICRVDYSRTKWIDVDNLRGVAVSSVLSCQNLPQTPSFLPSPVFGVPSVRLPQGWWETNVHELSAIFTELLKWMLGKKKSHPAVLRLTALQGVRQGGRGILVLSLRRLRACRSASKVWKCIVMLPSFSPWNVVILLLLSHNTGRDARAASASSYNYLWFEQFKSALPAHDSSSSCSPVRSVGYHGLAEE